MNYILNDEGEVQVRREDGTTKFLPKDLAENAILMRTYKMTIVEAPAKFECAKSDKPESFIFGEKELKADKAPAKKMGRPKTK